MRRPLWLRSPTPPLAPVSALTAWECPTYLLDEHTFFRAFGSGFQLYKDTTPHIRTQMECLLVRQGCRRRLLKGGVDVIPVWSSA